MLARIPAIVAAATLAACGAAESVKTVPTGGASRTIDMPHYSFTMPSSWSNWTIKKEGGRFESVLLADTACCTPPLTYQVKLLRNTALSPNALVLSAKEIADDYRKVEERSMLTEGVMKGKYKLYDVVSTDEALDGKTAYVMRYRAVMGDKCQKAAMLLLFPKDSGNEWFIVAHYSLATTREWDDILKLCTWETDTDLMARDFVDMLKGLEMH
jgi:hypothetical protein